MIGILYKVYKNVAKNLQHAQTVKLKISNLNKFHMESC